MDKELLDAMRSETKRLSNKANYHRRESERHRQLFLASMSEVDKITMKRKQMEETEQRNIRRVWQELTD